MIFGQSGGFDWQVAAVGLSVLGALTYLAVLRLRKKTRSCGKGACGCIKKKP